MRVLQQFAGATMLSTGILYFGKYLWWIYIQTPVGHQYVSLFGERAIVVTALFSQDLLILLCHISSNLKFGEERSANKKNETVFHF